MLSYLARFPERPRDGQPLLILLHGRGSNEEDLLVLADFLPEVMVISARAPFLAEPWGYGPGYAWYRYLGGATPDPEHFQRSLDALHAFMQSPPSLPARPGPIVLGGFSQGGTISLGYALRHPGQLTACVNMSGFLAEHPSVPVTAETVGDTCFFWPHGLHDQAVPYSVAQEGRARLLAADAFLSAPDYPIGHTISRQEIEDLKAFLDTL